MYFDSYFNEVVQDELFALTNERPRSTSRQMIMGTNESVKMKDWQVKWFQRYSQFLIHLQTNKMTAGQPSPPSRPFNTMNHCSGSTRIPYLCAIESNRLVKYMKEFKSRTTYFNRFSNISLKPPMVNSRKPQLTRPVKSWNPELHENRESLGRWHLQMENNNNGFKHAHKIESI